MSYIETERLIVRTWMSGDAPALAAIYGDPETMKYILSGTKTLEQTRALIVQMGEAQERDGCSMWPVVLKESSELIGSCGLMKTERERVLELGFAFAPQARGKGYAYEAARGRAHLRVRTAPRAFNRRLGPSVQRSGDHARQQTGHAVRSAWCGCNVRSVAATCYATSVMAKKKRRKIKLVPRLGPPTNLRPAGAHETLTRYNRKRRKKELREELGETDLNVD